MTASATAPPAAPTGRALRAPLVVGAGGMALASVLHLRDPNVSGSYGFCPFKLITGWDCPGCGGLRAVHALTDLDLGAALSSNVLVVLLVAALSVAYLAWIPRRLADPRASMIAISSRTGVVLIAVGFVFTVVRNTPWGSWLAP